MVAIFTAVMAVLGLAFGSFANVVIWRFPRGESLSHPPSRCPACEAPIRWRDNVPVFSWIALRGRCRECGARISPRYPIVESVSALLFLVAAVEFGPTARAAFAAAFFYLLLVLSAIDLDTYRLPNPIVGLTAAIAVTGAVAASILGMRIVPLADYGGWLTSPLAAALVGAVASGGVALALASAYAAVRKREGFGMGDVKLLAAIGLFLGPYSVFVLFFASVIGAVVGVLRAIRDGEGLTKAYPFGPFLALAAVIVALVGADVWLWYLGLL